MFEIHDCKAEIHGIFDYSISLVDNPQDHASYFCSRYRKKLYVMQ